jgi:hypothetical protein
VHPTQDLQQSIGVVCKPAAIHTPTTAQRGSNSHFGHGLRSETPPDAGAGLENAVRSSVSS